MIIIIYYVNSTVVQFCTGKKMFTCLFYVIYIYIYIYIYSIYILYICHNYDMSDFVFQKETHFYKLSSECK